MVKGGQRLEKRFSSKVTCPLYLVTNHQVQMWVKNNEGQPYDPQIQV